MKKTRKLSLKNWKIEKLKSHSTVSPVAVRAGAVGAVEILKKLLALVNGFFRVFRSPMHQISGRWVQSLMRDYLIICGQWRSYNLLQIVIKNISKYYFHFVESAVPESKTFTKKNPADLLQTSRRPADPCRPPADLF